MNHVILSHYTIFLNIIIFAVCLFCSLCATQMGLSKVALFVMLILSSHERLCKCRIGMYVHLA